MRKLRPAQSTRRGTRSHSSARRFCIKDSESAPCVLRMIPENRVLHHFQPFGIGVCAGAKRDQAVLHLPLFSCNSRISWGRFWRSGVCGCGLGFSLCMWFGFGMFACFGFVF